MVPLTRKYTLVPLLSATTDASAFAALSTGNTKPTSDDCIDKAGGDFVSNHFMLAFFGERASGDNETAQTRVIVWRPDSDGFWHPTVLGVFDLTLGARTRDTGQYMADTITANGTPATAEYRIRSNADDLVAYLLVDVEGSFVIQVQLKKGTCAKVNAMVGEM